MPTFLPEKLAEWTAGVWTARPPGTITGFTMDTRTLRAGQVFVALRTAQRDGHDYLEAARAAGASAALVAQARPAVALPQLVVADPLLAFQAIGREHRRAFPGAVVGVSGSAGKTSTKNLLALLLGGEDGGVLATEGNLNNHLGVPLTLTRLDPAQHRFAVVEAGISAPGDMAPLARMIEPDVALITLVAPAHLAELGTIDAIAHEKALLPSALRAAGVAVFPNQCAGFSAFRDLAVRTMVVEPAEVLRPAAPARDKVYFAVTQRGDTTAIALAYGAPPPLVFTMPRVSEGMAQNAALAICTALWLGVAAEKIQERLGAWRPGRLRGELRREAGRLYYVDCYNANPASMRDALQAFSDLTPDDEPRLFVLGGMEELGPESAGYHRALGRGLRLRAQDELLLVGDHADAVRAGAIASGALPRQVEVVESLAPITARLEKFRGAVFVKGSRRYQLERALPAVVAGEAAHA